MATSGWQQLGNVLGGGVDRETAYETGRLRTAQTENALLMAKNRQLDNIAAEAKAKARSETERMAAAAGLPPEQAALLGNLVIGESGSDFNSGMSALSTKQEMGYRDVLGNPEAPLGEQFAAGQAVQGKMLNPLDMMGSGDYTDLRALPAPGEEATLYSTPVGKSSIAENEAQTRLADARSADPDLSTTSGGGGVRGPGGLKTPNNFMPNPAFDASLPMSVENPPFVPIPGSPADPNAPAPAGSRESVFNERMFLSAAQTIPDVTNLMLLPATANTGVMGIGSRPGDSIVQSSVDALRNTLSGEVVRSFERQAGQLARGLAWMEANGLAPSEAVIQSYKDGYTLRPGDSGFDAMLMFANVRQTVEQMAQVKLANPRIPQVMKQELIKLRDQLRAAIPFLPQDVITLQYGGGRYRTMADVVREKGLGTPGAGAAPGAPAPAGGAPTVMDFATEAEAEAAAARGELQPGTRITVGGIPGVWQ